jgi:hypothetical protein
MKTRASFTLATALCATAACAQLQQTCMVVESGFYNLSEAGFVQTADGGFASAGPFSETNDGYNEIGVTRFDANGDLLWMRKWTTGNNDNIFPQALVATDDGGLVLAGVDQATGPQNGWFIVKLDASGTLAWAKTYASPDFSLTGSIYSDGFIQTNDGGFAVIANGSGFPGSYCTLRTDANGNLLWSGEVRNTGVASDVAELPNGDLIFTGWKEGFLQPHLVLRKDGLTGTTEWMHWYNSTTDEFSVYGVTIGPDSTIVMVGHCSVPVPGTWVSIGVMALDAAGTPLWMTKVRTDDGVRGNQITPHPDGGYVIAGTANEALPPFADIAPCIVKLDANGQLEWSKRYPPTSGLLYSWFSRISITDDGDLLVTGRTAATNTYVQRLLKLAPDGSTCPYCPSQDTGSYQALVPQIAPDLTFEDMGPWAAEAPLTLTMTDLTATVLAAMCGTTGIEDAGPSALGTLAPNPFTTSTTLRLPSAGFSRRTILEIRDATGRTVRQQLLTSEVTTIERGGLCSGSYVYRVTDGSIILARGMLQAIDL